MGGAALSFEAATRLPPVYWGPRVSRDEGGRGVAAGRRRVGGVVAARWRHGGGASGCRCVQRCARGAKALLLPQLKPAQRRRRATGASRTIDGAASGSGGARVAGPLEESVQLHGHVRNLGSAFKPVYDMLLWGGGGAACQIL